MIVVACLPCSLAIRIMPLVMGDASSCAELDMLVGHSSEFWPDKYPCPSCTQPATGVDELDVDQRVLQVMRLHDLTPQEAFAAFLGMGLPEEQRCSMSVLQELLREQPVRKVIGTDVEGAERTVVDALELWDGTKVHFGAGSDGAVVYRIVRPISYTERVLREEACP